MAPMWPLRCRSDERPGPLQQVKCRLAMVSQVPQAALNPGAPGALYRSTISVQETLLGAAVADIVDVAVADGPWEHMNYGGQ
jgi:hypothetical protein